MEVAREAARVLIVDDDAHWRGALRIALEGEGFDVVAEASNGPDAALLAGKHAPQVVVIDEHMRAMSGAHTAAVIRRILPTALVAAFCEPMHAPPSWADAVIDKRDVAGAGAILRASVAGSESSDAPVSPETEGRPTKES